MTWMVLSVLSGKRVWVGHGCDDAMVRLGMVSNRTLLERGQKVYYVCTNTRLARRRLHILIGSSECDVISSEIGIDN